MNSDISSKDILVNGTLSRIYAAGSGSDVVMLHGWGSRAMVFTTLIKHLSERYRVTAVDFPGFGGSEEPGEVWGVEDYASWAEALFQKLDIKNPLLIGHSFGGRVSLILASRLELHGLVLIGTPGLILPKRRKVSKKARAFQRVKKLASLLPPSLKERLIEKAVQKYGSIDYRNASPLMREVMKKVLSQDLKEYCSRVSQPTRLIWGETDQETTLEVAEKMNELIPNSTLKVLDESGHFPFIDKPDHFTSEVDLFLQELSKN